jgi:hypothetical protein
MAGRNAGNPISSWNIIKGSSIKEIPHPEINLGNIALKGRLAVEKRINELQKLAEERRAYAVRILNGEDESIKDLNKE